MNAPVQLDIEGGVFVETPFLAQKAGAIRALAKNVARDIVEIGRHLTEAKASCKHGEWLPWLESEFAWSERQARNFMQVFEAFGKSANFADFNLPLSSVYSLSAPSTPEPARAEAIARAEAGETVTRADVDAMIAKAKADAAAAIDDAQRQADEAVRARVQADQRALELELGAATKAEVAAREAKDAARAEMDALKAQIEAAQREAVEREQAARDEAQGKIATAEAQVAEAKGAILKIGAEASAIAEKNLAALRAEIETRDAEIARVQKNFDESRKEVARLEKMTTKEIKQLRNEISEASEIVHIVREAFLLIEKAPAPPEGARRARKQLSHAINSSKAREAGQWLVAFADAWDKESKK